MDMLTLAVEVTAHLTWDMSCPTVLVSVTREDVKIPGAMMLADCHADIRAVVQHVSEAMFLP